MIFTCAKCGKQFEAVRKSKYCLSCRASAYRTNNTQKQRERRAEMYLAEHEEQQKQDEAKRQKWEKVNRERNAKYRRKLEKKARSGDLLARLSLETDKTRFYYSAEYWQAFRDYRLDFDGDLFETVVNGISTREDDFVERVVSSMTTCKRLETSITVSKSNDSTRTGK